VVVDKVSACEIDGGGDDVAAGDQIASGKDVAAGDDDTTGDFVVAVEYGPSAVKVSGRDSVAVGIKVAVDHDVSAVDDLVASDGVSAGEDIAFGDVITCMMYALLFQCTTDVCCTSSII